MKLQEMINQGYALRGWALKTVRGERRVVVKLKRHERTYVTHSPFVDTKLSDVEFTEPVMVKL